MLPLMEFEALTMARAASPWRLVRNYWSSQLLTWYVRPVSSTVSEHANTTFGSNAIPHMPRNIY